MARTLQEEVLPRLAGLAQEGGHGILIWILLFSALDHYYDSVDIFNYRSNNFSSRVAFLWAETPD